MDLYLKIQGQLSTPPEKWACVLFKVLQRKFGSNSVNALSSGHKCSAEPF